ncbi:MAG TPA: glycosyltransferase family 4 protein [Chthonomonadaceae bacterium]|nr:glycosyltransferase family 4 protein [Chthonomonadaceae bacterium]
MHVLQMIGLTYPCGSTNHVLMLTRGLVRRGHTVTVLGPSGHDFSEHVEECGGRWLDADFRVRPFVGRVQSYAQFVRAADIDLIHAHMTRAAYCAVVLGRITNRPVAASVHITTHDFVYRKLVPFGNNRVVAVSDYLRKEIEAQGVPGKHIATVHNGTDFDVCPASDCSAEAASAANCEDRRALLEEWSLPSDSELVGLVGHAGGPKGYDLLVRAARSIAASRPRARFVFAGYVPPDVEASLADLARSEGVTHLLRFIGHRTDVPRIMRALDVLTMPSENEAFGMAIIEAMACSKPVVGTLVGGIPEVIADGVTGLLIERDPCALSAAVISLLSDPFRRMAMGAAGLERVRAHFTADAMTCSMEAMYEDMLAGTSGK